MIFGYNLSIYLFLAFSFKMFQASENFPRFSMQHICTWQIHLMFNPLLSKSVSLEEQGQHIGLRENFSFLCLTPIRTTLEQHKAKLSVIMYSTRK